MKKKHIILSALAVVFVLLGALTVFMLNNNKQPHALSNIKADENTVKLYNYIVSLEKTAILSGQQESTWMGSCDYETDFIYENTGKLPAIKGFDYVNDDFDGVNERAAKWHKKGGIVTICWHCGSDFSGEWKDCMESTVSDWEKMLTQGTKEYEQMISGMDKAAAALKELKEISS